MCGIVGVYGAGGLEPMLRAIQHRGPDEEGRYLARNDTLQIGIRRLNIIDLVTGSQPIHNEDGRLHIVYNGEVFNYLELRRELENYGHHFYTQSDTEVVLHAYEQWGLDCFSHFIGQWALCITDDRKLLLCRDRMGEKPLYYAKGDGWFAFASEIKALHPRFTGGPRIPMEFWVFESAPEGETLFENVRELPPASYLIYDCETGDLQIDTYWAIKANEYDNRSEDDLAEELRALIEDAVRLRLRSDVPWGVALSGGVDSAAIACIAKPDVVFSVRFPLGPKFDELSYAEMVAQSIGAEHHVMTPDHETMRETLEGVIWSLDQPVATASPFADFVLAHAASQRVKVLLGGQGSDECFGGYTRYLVMQAELMLKAQPELANYHSMMRYFWGPELFGPPPERYFKLIRRDYRQEFDRLVAQVWNHFDRCLDPISGMGLTDLHLTLPPLITMNDRSAAAFGIENRSPFLDHRLVEFGFRLRPELKIKNFTTKYLLRKALRGIVPDAVLDRQDKKGLVVPFVPWLIGRDAPLNEWCGDLFMSLLRRQLPTLPQLGTKARGEFDRRVYTAMTLELWFRRFYPEARF